MERTSPATHTRWHQGLSCCWSFRALWARWWSLTLEDAALSERSIPEDYVWREGKLASSDSAADGRLYYHLDHLGTPRWVSNSAGGFVRRHDYFPFGEEYLPVNVTEPMRFTGHERDFGGMGGADRGGDLDYMHARYFSPALGTFMSMDPVNGTPANPQSWNRYAYVLNNPLKFVDPDGEFAVTATFAVGALVVGAVSVVVANPETQKAVMSFGATLAEGSQNLLSDLTRDDDFTVPGAVPQDGLVESTGQPDPSLVDEQAKIDRLLQGADELTVLGITAGLVAQKAKGKVDSALRGAREKLEELRDRVMGKKSGSEQREESKEDDESE